MAEEKKKNPIVNMDLVDEISKAERILALMIASPQSGPSPGVLAKAKGFAFLRVTKVGFAISGRAGTGLIVKRLEDGSWSAPSAIGTGGISWGLQLGAQVADFMMVLNTDEAVHALSGTNQVSLGAQVAAVAGPVGAGREAGVTAAQATAPVFTYAISKGLFAGVSLEGSVIMERKKVNEAHYGKEGVRATQILSGEIPATPAAASLHEALTAALAKDAAIDAPAAEVVPPPQEGEPTAAAAAAAAAAGAK
ncbi:hypothetical protein CTAYLR_008129 [Chrysophaeum taylorii]|uniref:Ysc84 actin-binding domain-containing protein n=1 Tax=Chrysophaeum taylorii TaxID=2483200 RepID=A0AAD7UKK3_9STRA|nr:hypothetical protein CTAYLR_008129 [Chrysophaeum taylorii]